MQMLILQSINLHSFTSMTEFTRDYNGMDPLVSGSAIHPLAYIELIPMFVFNVSKQSERLNHGVVDITVEVQFSENVAANTKAYALVISDGKKINVLY